jgi:hypothetical protein
MHGQAFLHGAHSLTNPGGKSAPNDPVRIHGDGGHVRITLKFYEEDRGNVDDQIFM